jgi:hypothetical protein
MPQHTTKLPQAVELPICPFCDGKIYYSTWVTHKIYQMECTRCHAHWRTGVGDAPERSMYIELTQTPSVGHGDTYLNQKLPLSFWRDLVLTKIKI